MMIDDIKSRKNLSAAEALVYGYTIFKANIVQIMYIVLIIYFPLNLISGYISLLLSSLEAGINLEEVLSSYDAMLRFAASSQYMAIARNSLIKLVLDLFLAPFGIMAVMHIVKSYCEQKETGYMEALKVSFSYGTRFLWIRFIYCILIGILNSLAIIPGVIFAVFWYFNIQALALDGKKGRQAFSYSRELVGGRWFKTLLMLISFKGISYGIGYLLSFFLSWGTNTYFVIVLIGVLLSIVSTVFISAETVVYLNYQANMMNKSKVKALSKNDNQ